MNKIIQYLNYEDYRGFVEKSAFDDTYIISLLKVLDKKYFEVIRYETPVSDRIKQIKSYGPISYYRPDFQEFRERVITHFEPEPWTSLIVLLPCSAKKPYSESKSHKRFLRILRTFPEFPCFQEIIITSPLGAIPRQLENVYPINIYDISVTGEWDEQELTLASLTLIKLLKKYDDRIPIICHLDGDYLNIVTYAMNRLNNKFYFSKIGEKVTSIKSLESLKSLIDSHKEDFTPEKIPYQIPHKTTNLATWTRKIEKILDFQYGLNSGIKIIDGGVKIRKNKDGTQIELIEKKSGYNLGTFRTDTGQIVLSFNGAGKLKPYDKISNILVFDGEKIEGTTLFRPGVIEYSPDLMPNQYILILNKSKTDIIALGQLLVSSKFIQNSTTGRIAKIYDKK